MATTLVQLFIAALLMLDQVGGFRPLIGSSSFRQGFHVASPPLSRIATRSNADEEKEPAPTVIGVVAPLKYMGPYPALSLRLPNNSNAVVDFLLDTGANLNAIDARLVKGLKLPIVLKADELPVQVSAGMGGRMLPGDIVSLGDCELVGIPGLSVTFMRNLTAAALPKASPIGHGLLGLGFFMSFPAGVEFDWNGTEEDGPTVAFYFGKDPPSETLVNMTCVPLVRLAVQILSVAIRVNGTELRAIIDTGSPFTILTSDAAAKAGIEWTRSTVTRSSFRKHHPEIGDETLVVRGVDSGVLNLYRSVAPVSIRTATKDVKMGTGPVYVGDLPAFSLMRKFGAEPDAVLGLDFFRRTSRVLLRVSKNELWMEEMRMADDRTE